MLAARRALNSRSPIASINATGWDATYRSPIPAPFQPAAAPRYISLIRQGFTQAGAPTTYVENLVLTQQVRLVYPNQASLDPTRVALSDFVYSTDTIVGVTNNSTLTSPAPVCNFVTPDRQTVGNTLTVEVVAFHRNARGGQQVACVVFTATDGTNTVSQTVTGATVSSTTSSDQAAVLTYRADLNIPSLNAGQITVNAKVYPWIGGAASIADSSLATQGTRAFCPQIYLKNVTTATTPMLVYVSPTGNDATGVASTTAATASASPFATIGPALTALRTANGGHCDGCRVRLMAGTNSMGTVAYNTYTQYAEFIIEADPNATPSTAILTLGANFIFNLTNWIRFRGITLNRTVNTAQIKLQCVLENCIIADASGAYSLFGSGVFARVIGCTFTSQIPINEAAGNAVLLVRGCTLNASSAIAVSPWLFLGNKTSGVVNCFSLSLSYAGSITAFNKFMGAGGASSVWQMDQTGTITGAAFVQNLIEVTANSGRAFGPSADGQSASVTHLVSHHNTIAGFWSFGRNNELYNETLGGVSKMRTHTLNSFVGNIWTQINTKNDVFYATDSNHMNGDPTLIAADGSCSLRVGGWSHMYGVGCKGEVVCFPDAYGASGVQNGTGSSFSQAYAGLGSICGASSTVSLAVNFTSYQGVTSAGATGAGGGNYTITSGSVAQGRVINPVLPFDLAGNPRHATGSAAGAYEL